MPRQSKFFVYDQESGQVVEGRAPVEPCSATWPKCCDASGVNPEQRFEVMEQAQLMGVPTECNELGQMVYESRGHRKRYLEALGMFDRDGGYGDPQPGAKHFEGDTPPDPEPELFDPTDLSDFVPITGDI